MGPRAGVSVLLTLLLACNPGAPVAAAPASPAPAVATPAPAAVTPPPAKPEDGRELGGRWFVLLSSKLEPGVVPPALAIMGARPDLAGHPARLSSTWFKNLMPCYEIVIADSFPATKDGKAAALAWSGKLTAAGVDNYVKAAGDWVGERPELDGYCASVREPPSSPQGWWFVDEVGVPVTVDASVEAALPAPPLVPDPGGYEVWRASLPARNLGSWQVDQELVGVTATGTKRCRVKGFARGVVGTPHFGALHAGPPRAPACGEEALYATLDCDALLVAPATANPTVWTATKAAEPPWRSNFERQVAGELKADREEAASHVAGTSERVDEVWTATRYTSGAFDAWLVEVQIQTGEGFWYCGGEDFLSRRAWWVSAAGQVWAGGESIVGERIVAVADLDGDHRPELLLDEEISGSHRAWSGTTEARLDRAYCDCPC